MCYFLIFFKFCWTGEVWGMTKLKEFNSSCFDCSKGSWFLYLLDKIVSKNKNNEIFIYYVYLYIYTYQKHIIYKVRFPRRNKSFIMIMGYTGLKDAIGCNHWNFGSLWMITLLLLEWWIDNHTMTWLQN